MKGAFVAVALMLGLGISALADGCFVTADKRDIHEPTQKALIVYECGREDLVLQVRYAGATENFAWLVPTPARPNLVECSEKIFYDLAVFTHPVLKRGFGGAFGG